MAEVLTQTAEATAATAEVQTPAATIAPPNPTTAAGSTPADGATTPNPHATPPAESQPASAPGLTVETLTNREQLDAFIGEIVEGRMKLGDDLGEVPPLEQTETPAQASTVIEEAVTTPPAQQVPPTTEVEEGLAPPGQLPKALKMHTQGDPLRFETMRIMKEWDASGKKGTFGEAETLARQVLNQPVETPAPEATQSSQPSPEGEGAVAEAAVSLPKTIADTNEQIKKLNRDKAALAAGFRFEEAADLDNQILDLQEHRETLRLNERQTKAAELSYNDTWTNAANAAANEFRDHGGGNPDSALSILAGHIQSEWINGNDERLNDPAKAPTLIYQAALEKLGIKAAAPATPPGAQPPAAAPVTPSEVSPVKPAARQLSPAQALLASGNAGGVPPQRTGVDLDRFTNAHDLDAAIQNGVFNIVE